MKTFKLLALASLFAVTLFACEDPLEEIKPIKEDPIVTTNGGGDGGGAEDCGYGCK